MKALTARARKIATIAVASVCIVLGLLTVWTPLPTGVPLLALGVVLLVTVSTTARQRLRSARGRSEMLDRGIHFVEQRAHRSMATMLKRTRPLARKASAKAALAAANKALRASSPKKEKPPAPDGADRKHV